MTRLNQQTPPFLYLATSTTGRRSLGVRQARSERALSDLLRQDRKVLLRSWRLPAWLASEQGLTLKDHAQLNELMGQLVGRGVPLVEALHVIAQTVRPQARPRVERLAELVAAGDSFADACRKVGSFDQVTIAVYRAAERTGDLAGAGEQMAVAARRRLEVVNKAITLMIYPLFVLTIGVLAALFMLVVIIPRVASSLAQAGADLPGYTRAMVGTGTFLQENWLWALLVAAGVALGAFVARQQIIAAAQSVSRRLPMLRDVVLAQESANFFTIMAAMTRTGVPLADALTVSLHAIGHPQLRAELLRLRDRLVEGGVLRNLIEDVHTLPISVRRLLIAAERAGDLENAFGSLAADMTVEVEKRSSRLLAALEPTLLLLLVGAIGAMLLSIMIPLLTATSQAF